MACPGMALLTVIMIALFALNKAAAQEDPLPDFAVLKTLVRYDKSFLEDFDGDKRAAEEYLKIVSEKTEERLNLLPVKVNLEVTGYEYYPNTILPIDESIDLLYAKHRSEGEMGKDVHVSYFCKEGHKGRAGTAAGGCGNGGGWFNINACCGNCSFGWGDGVSLDGQESWGNVQCPVGIYTHELGHNLGMSDTEDGGTMGGKPGSWSENSRQEFEAWMSKTDSSCLEKN